MLMKYVAYYRVPSKRHGPPRLSLQAQQAAVRQYTGNCADCIVAEITETDKDTLKPPRTKVTKAIAQARKHNATLLIAQPDSLLDAQLVTDLIVANVPFDACRTPETDKIITQLLEEAHLEVRLKQESDKLYLKILTFREKIRRINPSLTRPFRRDYLE
jgi:hypothetical protein